VNQVRVTLTRNIVGSTLIYPYARHMQVSQLPIYEVPLYQLRIEPNTVFKAVRFGLTPQDPPPATRTCNVGLFRQRVAHPAWVPGYSPHSFAGAGRPGAWRILPGQQYLLHEGSDPSEGSYGGSLGCVELAGAMAWNSFLSTLERLAGANCAAIGAAQAMTLVIENATYTQARLKRIIQLR